MKHVFANRSKVFCILICLTASLSAQRALNDRIHLTPCSEAPKIDGRLDDPAWETAALIDEYLQREPQPGQPATERTETLVTFDRDNIYFAFRCLESDPNGITAKELARDADLSTDDRVQIIIDTFLDRRSGYWFQIGPRGSIGDALVSENGSRFNKQWDGLWAGKARIHDQGWDAEVAIPFKSLNFRPGQTEWGLKLIRHLKRKEEIVYWPQGSLDTYRFQISDSGTMEGLTGISQGKGLELQAYGLAGYDQHIREDNAWVRDAGLDVYYQLTPGVKAALTVNTDFAETEVDARRINLTRFPLFFPEKRDFFLDGSNYFTFGPNESSVIPFFSRRLGLDPGGNPLPIIVGAKVTGQQGPWNLGFLNITDDHNSDNRNFTVARISRNFREQSSVGMILTSGNSLSEQQNMLVGADVRLATSRFQGDKNLSLSLYGLKSNTEGIENRDTAWGLGIFYPNDFLNIGLGFQQIEENFVAGIGFVPRTDIRQASGGIQIGPRPGRHGLRQLSFGAEIQYLTNLDNRLLTRTVQYTPLKVLFDSGDTISAEIVSHFEFLDDVFHIHSDYAIPTGGYSFLRYEAGFQSAKRRNVWAGTEYSWGEFYNGRRTETELSAGYKVAVPLYLEGAFESNRIELPEGAFTANISRLNVNILFSPDVTLHNFVQYDNFSGKMGWQSRFYWILKPGNEIIVVWNSSWNDPFERFELTESTARFKVNYNYRF